MSCMWLKLLLFVENVKFKNIFLVYNILASKYLFYYLYFKKKLILENVYRDIYDE